jgi:hypothetical protein
MLEFRRGTVLHQGHNDCVPVIGNTRRGEVFSPENDASLTLRVVSTKYSPLFNSLDVCFYLAGASEAAFDAGSKLIEVGTIPVIVPAPVFYDQPLYYPRYPYSRRPHWRRPHPRPPRPHPRPHPRPPPPNPNSNHPHFGPGPVKPPHNRPGGGGGGQRRKP